MTMPSRSDLIRMRAELGTFAKLAEHYGVTVSVIYNWVHKYGLPTRQNNY